MKNWLKTNISSNNQLSPEEEIYREASLLGLAAGLGSTLPLTLLLHENTQTDEAETTEETNQQRNFMALVTLGEMIGGRFLKPSKQLNTRVITMRLLAGAAAGAFLCYRANESITTGAARGALGAGAGTVASYALKNMLPDLIHIPGFMLSGVEEGLSFWISRQIAKKHG